MPDIELVKRDRAAIDAELCPETGVSLKDMAPEDVRHHARRTFPRAEDSEHLTTDYGRRYRLLMQYADGKEKVGGKK